MDDELRPGLFRIIARYATSRLYQKLLGFLLAFLRPTLLRPEDYGLWTLLRLVPMYTTHAHMGTRDSLRYLIPYYRAGAGRETVARLGNSAFAFSLWANLTIAAALVIAPVVLDLDAKLSWGLISMGVTTLALWFYELLLIVHKGYEHFTLMTRVNYFYTSFLLVITVPALLLFGIYGLFLTVPLAYAAGVVYMQRNCCLRFRLEIHGPELRELLNKGLPIMALSFVVTLTATTDRFLVSSLLGVEQTGYYGLAALAVGFLREVPGAAREVMEPRLMKLADRLGEGATMEQYLLLPLRHTAFLLPLLIGPTFLMAAPLLEFLLPEYLPAVPAVRVLSLGVIFIAFIQPLIPILVAGQWQLQAVVYGLPAIAVNVAAGLLLVSMGLGIEGIALASTLSFATLFVAFLVFVDRRLGVFRRTRPGFWVRLAVPYFVMTGALLLIDHYVTATGWPGAGQRFLGLLAFGVLMGSLWRWDRSAKASFLRRSDARE